MKTWCRWTASLVGVVCVALSGLAIVNWHESVQRSEPNHSLSLSSLDKRQIEEALRIKETYGNDVWPGFGDAQIGTILFNDGYEFLTGVDAAPSPWVQVEGDTFRGNRYFRRVAERPQAFAVPVGGDWAGSIGAIGRMNREYLLGVRSELPPVLAQLFPYWMASVPPDLHAVGLVHEMFHAWQAKAAALHFRVTREYDRRHADYPYKDGSFQESWNREGSLLAEAISETGAGRTREIVSELLSQRDSRRAAAALPEDLRAYERHMEWLEGLALYVEIRSYESAARSPSVNGFAYDPGLPHWQHQFRRLAARLGSQDGDHRFYISGMAMAKVLDKLLPGWKSKILHSETCLEDLLRVGVGPPDRRTS